MRTFKCLFALCLTTIVSAQCDLRAKGSRDASWSPDGSQIVFSSNESGKQQIYLMKLDGSDRIQLTDSEFPNYYPFFSPNGSKIVFMSYRDPQSITMMMNADGSDIIRVSDADLNCADPHWSPDGSGIIFYSDKDGNNDIYTMNLSGGNMERLTTNEFSDQTPSISPDGKFITFVSNRDGNAEIYVMNRDGSNQRRLTNDPRSDRVPSWSFDSQKIIYYSREPSSVAGSGSLSWIGAEIYEVDLNGNRKQLTHNNHLDQGPVYSPDGKKILVTSCATGNREVFMLELETGKTTQLTFTGRK